MREGDDLNDYQRELKKVAANYDQPKGSTKARD